MTKSIPGILSIPLEKQREIAKEDGYGDDLEAWQAEMQKSHNEAQAHIASLKTVRYEDLTNEQKLAQDRWQRKVESGNPVE
jgi:hypothetical protein